jgi:hypothetical protein
MKHGSPWVETLIDTTVQYGVLKTHANCTKILCIHQIGFQYAVSRKWIFSVCCYHTLFTTFLISQKNRNKVKLFTVLCCVLHGTSCIKELQSIVVTDCPCSYLYMSVKRDVTQKGPAALTKLWTPAHEGRCRGKKSSITTSWLDSCHKAIPSVSCSVSYSYMSSRHPVHFPRLNQLLQRSLEYGSAAVYKLQVSSKFSAVA